MLSRGADKCVSNGLEGEYVDARYCLDIPGCGDGENTIVFDASHVQGLAEASDICIGKGGTICGRRFVVLDEGQHVNHG